MIDQRQFFASAFDELEGITKEALGAGLVQTARGIGGAARMALRDPTKAGQLMKGVYHKAGGGLKGVGAVMRTPVGQAAAIGGGTMIAAPAAAGYAMGRNR